VADESNITVFDIAVELEKIIGEHVFSCDEQLVGSDGTFDTRDFIRDQIEEHAREISLPDVLSGKLKPSGVLTVFLFKRDLDSANRGHCRLFEFPDWYSAKLRPMLRAIAPDEYRPRKAVN
jgi:hypothetical protein